MGRTYLRDLSMMFTEFTIALLIYLPFLQSVRLNTLIQNQQFSQGSREFTFPLPNLLRQIFNARQGISNPQHFRAVPASLSKFQRQ